MNVPPRLKGLRVHAFETPHPQTYRSNGCVAPDRWEVSTPSSTCPKKVTRYGHQYQWGYPQKLHQQQTVRGCRLVIVLQSRMELTNLAALWRSLRKLSETTTWPQPRQSLTRTAVPNDPHPHAETETASENESDVSNWQEKQTSTWKMS